MMNRSFSINLKACQLDRCLNQKWASTDFRGWATLFFSLELFFLLNTFKVRAIKLRLLFLDLQPLPGSFF